MPDTLLSIFSNPDDLLSSQPEDLGGAILEVAPGVMQDGMFNIAGLLAPLFPTIGNGYPVGLQNQVRLAIAEALSWLTNQGLVMLDPDQPAVWYRPTRRGAQLKTRADVEAFRKGNFSRLQPERPQEITPPNPSGRDPGLSFATDTPLPLRVRTDPRGALTGPTEVFPPMPPSVNSRPLGTTLITPPAEVPPQLASTLLSGVGSVAATASIVHSQRIVEPAPSISTEPDDATQTAALPDLPPQGPGPHFELTKAGVIDFVRPESLDREGNNVARLRQLHPTLRELARGLTESLGTGNAPHAHLAARLDEYCGLIDQALDRVDFALLYVEGVRLANAEKAAIEKVAEGELPPLGETDREALGTLLQLHGTFMLSTIAGAELIAAEQRYRRRPAEEGEYLTAAVDFAASLQNKPNVITANAAAFVLGAAEQISQGSNLERSGVIATSTVLNVAITISAVAVVTALPVVGGLIGGPAGLIAGGLTGYMASESVKKSKPFAAVIAPIIAKLDGASELWKFKDFLLSVELKARRLARYNEQFLWLTRALDWIASTNPPFNKDLLRKVDELRISKRAADVLRNDNIVYVGDLVQKTVEEMVRSPGCTRSIVNELSENLASIGLHLGMELQDWPPENIEDIARELRRRT